MALRVQIDIIFKLKSALSRSCRLRFDECILKSSSNEFFRMLMFDAIIRIYFILSLSVLRSNFVSLFFDSIFCRCQYSLVFQLHSHGFNQPITMCSRIEFNFKPDARRSEREWEKNEPKWKHKVIQEVKVLLICQIECKMNRLNSWKMLLFEINFCFILETFIHRFAIVVGVDVDSHTLALINKV